MPSGKKAYPKIEDNKDGTVTVRYQPTEMGLHELHLLYNQEPIEGKSLQYITSRHFCLIHNLKIELNATELIMKM